MPEPGPPRKQSRPANAVESSARPPCGIRIERLRERLGRRSPRDTVAGSRPQAAFVEQARAGATSAATLAVLRRLRWPINRPLAGRQGGDARSLARTFTVELDDLRPYQPGDDVRHIDWKVTARSEQPYVRYGPVERALDAWLVLDVSASLDWATVGRLKRNRLLELVVLAGHVLGRGGHRLGALLFAERPLAIVPPGRGRRHLLRLIGHVGRAPRQATPAPTDLAGALGMAQTLLRRRGLIVIVSDFLVPHGWQKTLGRLAARHEVVTVRLTDPRDLDLPDVGLVTLEDPETRSQLLLDTSDPTVRERFAAAARAQVAQHQADLRRYGIAELALETGEEPLAALVRFLGRQQRSWRRYLGHLARPAGVTHGGWT